MKRDDHLEARQHSRAAEDIAPDLWPRVPRREIAALVIVMVIIVAALPFAAALVTLPLPGKP